jgi:N-acylneuraminate cytidylyltransferase
MDRNCIAIIPARKGSKRIPQKNIRPFIGRPILQYSIDAALSSHLFSEVMVSTDSAEIAMLAKSLGAKVPFMRSDKNADDYATLADVISEVCEQYKENGVSHKYFCCLLPTAPFISAKHLKSSFQILQDKGFDFVIPMVRFQYPIQRALRKVNDHVSMIWPENYKKRSQDLEPAFHDCGQFYWGKTEVLLREKVFFNQNCGAIELDEREVQDIDTEADWQTAEIKYQILKKFPNEE